MRRRISIGGLAQTHGLLNRQLGPRTAFGGQRRDAAHHGRIDRSAAFWFLIEAPYLSSPNRKQLECRIMNDMKDRQEGFERKFVLDEEQRFRAVARRNKLLGLWAAEKLGKSGAEADAYAKEVINSDFEEAGDHDVFRKIRKDFDAAGVAQSDHQIRRTMEELMATAVEQIRNA
jgi:hypothetical protein